MLFLFTAANLDISQSAVNVRFRRKKKKTLLKLINHLLVLRRWFERDNEESISWTTTSATARWPPAFKHGVLPKTTTAEMSLSCFTPANIGPSPPVPLWSFHVLHLIKWSRVCQVCEVAVPAVTMQMGCSRPTPCCGSADSLIFERCQWGDSRLLHSPQFDAKSWTHICVYLNSWRFWKTMGKWLDINDILA